MGDNVVEVPDPAWEWVADVLLDPGAGLGQEAVERGPGAANDELELDNHEAGGFCDGRDDDAEASSVEDVVVGEAVGGGRDDIEDSIVRVRDVADGEGVLVAVRSAADALHGARVFGEGWQLHGEEEA